MNTIMFEAVLENVEIDPHLAKPDKIVRIVLMTNKLQPEQLGALYERLTSDVAVRLK